jgi:RsiW-degrading membrane proteinase PrsW (M82 family)
MNTIIILVAALLPAALLWFYIWKKDPQKEPTSWLIRATILGVAICIPVGLVEFAISAALFGGEFPTNLIGTTAQAFFVAALPEEAAKLLALWLLLRKNPYFDEHFDGIVYAVCVGLGFAAIENVGYLSMGENWAFVAFMRALLAVPAHYAFAILMGYFYSVYHFVDHSPKMAACTLLVPVMAHGLYDALAMSGAVNEYVGGISFFVLIYFCVKMHKRAYRKIVALIEKDRDIQNNIYSNNNNKNTIRFKI